MSTSLTFLVMTYVSSSGDMATISWMVRPGGPGRGRGMGRESGVPGCDSMASPCSEAVVEEEVGAGGAVAGSWLFTDSSAELTGDSGAGLQLAEVLGVMSVETQNREGVHFLSKSVCVC